MEQDDPTYFNEMLTGSGVRAAYENLGRWQAEMPADLRSLKQSEAEQLFRRVGITFAVYGEGGDPERQIPFDMFPRVFTSEEWRKLDRGIRQRAAYTRGLMFDVRGRTRAPRRSPTCKAAPTSIS